MWGASWVKRILWNREFADGHWDFIETTHGDMIYPVLEKYCAGGGLLDLGCGAGNTVNEVGKEAFSHYTGVDISDVALAKAAERTRGQNREAKAEFRQNAIESFRVDRKFEVVLFRESLFYVPTNRVIGVLEQHVHHLTENGVFVVRMYDGTRYDGMIQLIKERFDVLEFLEVPDSPAIIMVFR